MNSEIVKDNKDGTFTLKFYVQVADARENAVWMPGYSQKITKEDISNLIITGQSAINQKD